MNSLRNSDVAIAKFVEQNIETLTKNSEIIWRMNSSVARGRVWEQVRKHSDLKAWEFIGSQNQKLLDFFYDKTGIIMQQKTIGMVTEHTLKNYIPRYAKVINDLDNVVRAKKFVLQGGRTLQVNSARLDIVIPKGLDASILKNGLQAHIISNQKKVILNIITK